MKQSTSKLGINLFFPSDIFLSCQTTTRRTLSQSKDPDVLQIYNDTKKFNIGTDTIIERANSSTNKNKKPICKKIMEQEKKGKSWCHFINLKKENIITTFLTNNIPINRLSFWHKVSLKLPNNIYNFSRKYLILALPTKANLRTWNIIENSTCDLCKQKSETQNYIVFNCQTVAVEKSYKWHHNSVLYTSANYMSTISQFNSKVYVNDIEGFPSPGYFFASSRPDLIIVLGDVYYVFELTVCFETNLIKSNEYKTKKYDDLCREVINKQVKLELFFIEISCVGFTSNNLKPF